MSTSRARHERRRLWPQSHGRVQHQRRERAGRCASGCAERRVRVRVEWCSGACSRAVGLSERRAATGRINAWSAGWSTRIVSGRKDAGRVARALMGMEAVMLLLARTARRPVGVGAGVGCCYSLLGLRLLALASARPVTCGRRTPLGIKANLLIALTTASIGWLGWDDHGRCCPDRGVALDGEIGAY